IEGHGHFLKLGYYKMNLDLMQTQSYDDVIAMVREEVKKKKPGEWILGRGWHQSKWTHMPENMVNGFPIHDALSAVSPDNPVWLIHASGHAGLANAKAMEVAGILDHPDAHVEGGEIVLDTRGKPTGIFNEDAQDLIDDHIPEHTLESDMAALNLAVLECLRNGITSFQDAGSKGRELEAFFTGLKKSDLGIRLYVMLSAEDRATVEQWLEKEPVVGLDGHFLTIRSIKIHADGALGSRGAWLLEPYSDMPSTSGMATEDMDYVTQVCEKALQKGYQVCTHAIGDRTNREILDRYEAAFKKYPKQADDVRFRIEHAQHINPQDIPRFAALGVIPSMQAIHLASDRPWAIDRLGEKRIVEGAYVWRKLYDTGCRIINGTDAPVEPVNPIPCFYASVSRKTLDGKPEGGYEPAQKMTREEALRSYTIDAAYGAFEEDIKGSVEVGKLADLTIWSKDIMKVDEAEILQTKALMTIVNGAIKYNAMD
ncbi:MAG: amidohydrolase, partial [Flavobacteriales bacterium]|nr:amidohydrolase [Flavobacteriales bacterium]